MVSDLKQELEGYYMAALSSRPDVWFYQAIYAYIGVVQNSKEITKLIQADKTFLKRRQTTIKADPVLSEEAKEQALDRVKRESLYADYILLHEEVYVPLNELENGFVPRGAERRQALYFLAGIENVPVREQSLAREAFAYHRSHCQELLIDLHEKLIVSLEVEESMPSVAAKTLYRIKYDLVTGTLSINDTEISINLRSTKTNASYVLDYLFDDENKGDTPGYKEIADLYFPNEPYNWKTWYRACEDISRKVFKQSDLRDFLVFTTGKTGSVRVNSMYLT